MRFNISTCLFSLASVEPFYTSILFSLLPFQFHYFCIAVAITPKINDLREKKRKNPLGSDFQEFKSRTTESCGPQKSQIVHIIVEDAQRLRSEVAKDDILAKSPFLVTFFLQLHLML